MSDATNDWLITIDADDLQDEQAVRVEVSGTAVLVVRTGADSFCAVAARCTHQGAPLDRGRLDLRGADPTVTCAAHGSVFSLVDGRVRRGPATQALQPFEVRVHEGTLQLRLRDR